MKVTQLENIMTAIVHIQTVLEVDSDAIGIAPIQNATDELEKTIMDQLQDKVIVRRGDGIFGLRDMEERVLEVQGMTKRTQRVCWYCEYEVPAPFKWHLICKLNNLEERLKTMEGKE